jgi:DTW domain-containing protein YfiP
LQHALEASKVSNTGRFVPLVLAGAELRPLGAKEAPFDASGLSDAGTALLFPDLGAPSVPVEDVRRLVVVDASWSQARRMLQRVPALRTLPRLSLTVTAPARSLRAAPPGALSTLQAVARALDLLGDAEAGAALERVHGLLLERTLGARGYV